MDLRQIWAYIDNYPHIQGILILAGFFIISNIVFIIFEKVFLKIASKTKTEVDDIILRRINRPVSFILFLIGVRLAVIPLGLGESILSVTNNIIKSLAILVAGYIIISVLDTILRHWGVKFTKRTKSHLDDSILSLFHRISQIAIYVIVILMVLSTWGIEVGPVLASLGIAGIAVAFALQSTLANIFGGIALIIDRTLKVGDVIKLDTGESGVVYDIGLRSTKIKTWDNEIITVPNGKLVDSRIQNFSLPDPSLRINIEFGVEYGSDPDQVKKVVLETVSRVENVMKEPAPNILFLSMGDFALNFKVMFWVDNLDKKWPTHQAAITDIYNALRKHHIGIPFPTRTVYMRKE